MKMARWIYPIFGCWCVTSVRVLVALASSPSRSPLPRTVLVTGIPLSSATSLSLSLLELLFLWQASQLFRHDSHRCGGNLSQLTISRRL